MVDGKDLEEMRKVVEEFEAMDRLFNEDGSVKTVEEVRRYRSPL